MVQHQQLKEVGSKLESPPASKDALIKLLKQAGNYLSEIGQSPLPSMIEALQPCFNAIVKPELLKHQDRDVEVLVATCICEITRITAPEAPYSDEILREIFHLFVGTFSGLNDISSPLFGRRVIILETLSRYKSCVMMLDLECHDLISKMFQTFFAVISDDHPESVLKSMQSIMILILDESEDLPENLLFVLLSTLGRKRNGVSMAARSLAMNVIENCAGKLETSVKQLLSSSISGDTIASSNLLDYHEVIFDIYQCAPQILFGVIPYITSELLTDQLGVRLKAVKLLGDMFALPGIISKSFKPLFIEFLKRMTDRTVEVRILTIEHVKNCFMSSPSRSEVPEIMAALRDRLLDYDENVRKEVVAAIFTMAYHSILSIPCATVRLVAERLRDKSVSVKRYTMERLAELYRFYCEKCSDDSINADDFEWIPGKILRCTYDKDFRSEMIEDIFCHFLFPSEFSMKDKLEHWVAIFSRLDKVEVKALEQILAQKQRLQQELQKYLSLRQTYQVGDNHELQKKTLGSFRIMSRLFNDPTKAEESFQILNQLKDVKIWKILMSLLDPSTSFSQASTLRDELLKILGDKHQLYDFMGTLSIRCSYLLFNKELVNEIFLKAAACHSDGKTQLVSCMNLLAVIAYFSPTLLFGFEEDLVCLLKEDNEIIKEGIAHVLAKAGGIIREKLAMTSSSVDLLLERLCLEGSRKQAKYSVQALAAITKDDGLKALSVLYKRLVDMLEEKIHLPAILQSLGCIAQNAMPVFETKEGEIVDFIQKKIFECSDNNLNQKKKNNWDARSELCLLKIFGIKTLVNSYMPLKDSHLRLGIENLLEILKNILQFGEISKNIESSPVDRAHLRLAAAKAILRLSKQWEHKIPLNIFYLTLRTTQNKYHEARKLFNAKVHQYIKERYLDAKYACAFLYDITGTYPPSNTEDTQYLIEVLQMHHQLKARQLSIQCDMNSHTAYPEYILTHLLHALAHHSSFPEIEDGERFQAFEPIYWRLHLFLSTMLYGSEKCHQANARMKDSISRLISIIHGVKCSYDIVDKTKTKNSKVLCELGMLIIKHLVKEEYGNLKELIIPIPLPPSLYKSLEKNDDDDSLVHNEKSWFPPKALRFFESLTLEKKADDSDTDVNELTLDTILKNIKLQRARKSKTLKKQAGCSKGKKIDSEVDVLGMVREINLRSEESEQGKKLRRMTTESNNAKSPAPLKMNVHLKRSSPSISNLKRKRTPYILKSNSKEQQNVGESLSMQSFEADEELANIKHDHSSDPLTSCPPANITFSSGSMKKCKYKMPNGRSHGGGANIDAKNEIKKENGNSAEVRKRKLKNIVGTTKKKHLDGPGLVGCLIKVWWPMDKQFYEGRVQSYDAKKNKHKILYDDGDIEVLRLDKQKWEQISNVNAPSKRQKNKKYSSEELSPERVRNVSTDNDAGKINRPSNRGRSKRTAKKHAIRKITEKIRDAASSDTTDGDNSNPLDSEIHATSEVDDAQSDGSRENRPCFEGEKSKSSLEIVEATNKETPNSSSSEGGKKPKDFSMVTKHSSYGLSSEPENSDDMPLNAWRQRAGK